VFTLEVTFGAAGSIDTRAIAATTLGSYAVVALVEGVLTALVVRGILSLRPDLVYVNRRQVAT
jgi:cobalt/nickel transport system permease protein